LASSEQKSELKRREFISLVGGAAAAWPVAARAQPAAMPVIGYLHSASAAAFAHLMPAFHKGLNEAGYVEGQNVVIEYRWAEGHNDRLASIAKRHVDAFLISPEALFVARRVQILTLAARHVVSAIYHRREFVEAGGLMSYGSNFADQFHLTGIYAGRILKGENPADMPVQLPTKFDFVINMQTARTLGIDVPTTLLARADEVIE
jgi:ABC-type uncharacterized transport system substrate-binding protein